MTSIPDLIILGGGIAGLTSALVAADRGLRVTVIDQERPGAASRASAGLLAPSIPGLKAAVLPAAIEARDLYPRFLSSLRERTGLDVPHDRNGILELADDEADLARITALAPAASARLDSRALTALEPAFAARVGGVLHPHDGAVDNVILMRALDVAVARHPFISRVVDEVTSFDGDGDLPALTTRGGTRHVGRRVLLASGAWAGTLPGLPRPLAVRPVAGQLMRLNGLPIRHATYAAGGYLVPRGASLLVGATSEETGFACEATPHGLRALRDVASRVIATLVHATVLEHWAGLRPISADGLPVLGADPDLPTLLYACGFSRNGILFAPWASEQLAPLFTGAASPRSLAPFCVDREGLKS